KPTGHRASQRGGLRPRANTPEKANQRPHFASEQLWYRENVTDANLIDHEATAVDVADIPCPFILIVVLVVVVVQHVQTHATEIFRRQLIPTHAALALERCRVHAPAV